MAIVPRVLVVEDEPGMQAQLCKTLNAAGYECRGVSSGEAALALLKTYAPDLILLDVTLAGPLTGFDVLAGLRKTNQSVRVIILTQQQGEAPAVRGLNLGADDFLTKGLSELYLLTRVGAHLRRTAARAGETYIHGAVEIDLRTATLRCDGRAARLGAVEHRVLACLVQNAGHPVDFRELMRAGWNYELPAVFDESDTHVLRALVYTLRRKLNGLIVNYRGVGFSLPPGEPRPDEGRQDEGPTAVGPPCPKP